MTRFHVFRQSPRCRAAPIGCRLYNWTIRARASHTFRSTSRVRGCTHRNTAHYEARTRYSRRRHHTSCALGTGPLPTPCLGRYCESHGYRLCALHGAGPIHRSHATTPFAISSGKPHRRDAPLHGRLRCSEPARRFLSAFNRAQVHRRYRGRIRLRVWEPVSGSSN